jgi:hypothetical protein
MVCAVKVDFILPGEIKCVDVQTPDKGIITGK